MSQAEFAAILGVGDKTYSAWESGKNTPQGSKLVPVAQRIELAFKVPAWWTLGLGSGSPAPDGPDGIEENAVNPHYLRPALALVDSDAA